MVENQHPRQRIPDLTSTLRDTSYKDTGLIVENNIEATVRRLTASARRFNKLAIEEYGGRIGPERFSVESTIAAAFQIFDGQELHPDPFEKAAVLLRGITGGHPFEDGNKRSGFLTSALYLEQAGFPMPKIIPATMYDLCMDISRGDLRDIKEIAQRYQELWNGDKTSGSDVSSAS